MSHGIHAYFLCFAVLTRQPLSVYTECVIKCGKLETWSICVFVIVWVVGGNYCSLTYVTIMFCQTEVAFWWKHRRSGRCQFWSKKFAGSADVCLEPHTNNNSGVWRHNAVCSIVWFIVTQFGYSCSRYVHPAVTMAGNMCIFQTPSQKGHFGNEMRRFCSLTHVVINLYKVWPDGNQHAFRISIIVLVPCP